MSQLCTHLRPRSNRCSLHSLLALGSVPTASAASGDRGGKRFAGREIRPQFDLRPYLEYSIGLSIVRNQNLSGGDPPNPDFWGRIETAEGANVGAAVGVRVLGLVSNRDSRSAIKLIEVEKQAVRPGRSHADGSLSLFTAMVNGYYDYDLADHGVPLIPFVGVGVGFGETRARWGDARRHTSGG